MEILKVVQLVPPLPAVYDEEQATLQTTFGLDQQEQFFPQQTLIPWNPSFVGNDEAWVPQPAPLAFQEDGFLPPGPAPLLFAPAQIDSEQFGLANFALEQEDPWIPAYQLIVWNSAVYRDEDALAQNFPLDQQDPWVPAFQVFSWNAAVYRDADESSPLANFPLDQQDPYVPAFQIFVWNSLVYRDEDALAQNFPLEQHDPYVPAFVAIIWNQAVYRDADELWPLANFPLDDSSWQPSVQAIPWLAVVFSDEDAVPIPPPTVAIDDDLPWVAQSTAIPWNAKVYQDDDSAEPLKNFALDQEEWQPSVQAIPWNAFVFRYEEEIARLTIADEDTAFIPARMALAWNPACSIGDEELARTTITDEDTAFLPARQSIPWNAAVSIGDEEIARITVTDEESQQAQIIWPAGAFRPIAADDEGRGFAVGTTIVEDESGWQPGVQRLIWLAPPLPEDSSWVFPNIPPTTIDAVNFLYLFADALDFSVTISDGVDFRFLLASSIDFLNTTAEGIDFRFLISDGVAEG